MAWVDLSAAFAYGSKLTSTQAQNLRDNILHVYNYFVKAAGALVIHGSGTQNDSLTSSYAKFYEESIGLLSGELRTKLYLESKNGTSTVSGQIYKNGSPVGTERSTNAVGGEDWTEDLSGWEAGDLFQVYLKRATSDTEDWKINIGVDTPLNMKDSPVITL